MNDVSGTGETTAAPSGIFANYRPPLSGYDEMLLAGSGAWREPWPRLLSGLENIGAAEFGQRSDQAKRLLRENGVTYNVYGAPEGPDRPWELDPLPLLIGSAEWRWLSAALAQRVSLLNAILADVYGPQTLLARGLLPPSLVFGHSGYLLPCHGIAVPNQQYLHLYAGHLARASDGQWVVLADRTQGPAGAGYAVENRIIASRLLPQEFHTLFVERLASFFISLRESLLALAPSHVDNPRVVWLSPGPRSSTYFEDTYLARYLGYALVEGGDLTVRGNQVFLKTLGGLVKVDVIVRRIPDEEADPLELKNDSMLGVPGLVQAVRSGQVAVANALGSGYLEAPALMAFLPQICRALRSEELLLPSVSTWWCGRPSDLNYVLEHVHELVVRPAFAHRAAQPILGWRLTKTQRQELMARIRQFPGLYAAQAQVARSTAPVWNGQALEPWRVGLRTFAVAEKSGEYRIMPGGLSRVSARDDFLNESVSGGQSSKDVWVLSEGPVEQVSLLSPPRAAVELRRSVNDLPSRAADYLYWLGRQAERAEGYVRHLRSAVVRLTNDVSPDGLYEAGILVHTLPETPVKRNGRHEGEPPPTFEELRAEVVSFMFDEKAGGLGATLPSLRHTASIVRDRLSIDTWRMVNQLDLGVLYPWAATQARLGDVLVLLNQLLNLLSAISGLASESMTRGPGWRFLDMGRRVERGLQSLRLIKNTLTATHGELLPILEAVLEIADSTMTYRYRYLTSLQLAPVLDLILVDETNPRAVGYQFSVLAEHMRQLPGEGPGAERRQEQRLVLAAQSALRLCDVDAYCETDEGGFRPRLYDFVEQLSSYLRQLSDVVTQRYLTHTRDAQRLGMFSSEPEYSV